MWLVWTATLTCLLLSRRWRRWRLVSRPPGWTPTSWCSRWWSWLWWGYGSEEWSKSLKIAYLCPDAGKQGIIDLPEFPFALEPRVSTRWKRPTRIQTEFLGQTFLYVVFFINSTWGAGWLESARPKKYLPNSEIQPLFAVTRDDIQHEPLFVGNVKSVLFLTVTEIKFTDKVGGKSDSFEIDMTRMCHDNFKSALQNK